MADLIETIVIPEVPRVLDGQELYVYIPENLSYYTKIDIDNLLATKVPITRKIVEIDLQDDITKNELAEALGISPDLNIKNGTDNVLIQTTDSNQSFKVMTDGRAKVFHKPIDNNDVVRLSEVNPILSDYVDDTLLGG